MSKTRTREPNGRLQREREFPPAQVRRLRDAALDGLRQPEWGTELGRLLLTRVITEAHYAAGKRWAEEAAEYRLVIGVREMRSASAEPGIGGQPPDQDSNEGVRLAKAEGRVIKKFLSAHAALSVAGTSALRAVRDVCETDRALCGHAEKIAFIYGLSVLEGHYGLTRRAKS